MGLVNRPTPHEGGATNLDYEPGGPDMPTRIFQLVVLAALLVSPALSNASRLRLKY